jgi:hypothetical protein
MLGDEMIELHGQGMHTHDNLAGEFCQAGLELRIEETFFQHNAGRVACDVDFVKCLQGNAARPGAWFHTI